MRYGVAPELDELERDIGPTSVADDVIAQLGKGGRSVALELRLSAPITDWLPAVARILRVRR